MRGEILLPWGTEEAKRLNIYDDLVGSCASEAQFATNYDSGEPGARRDLFASTPHKTGCLHFRHVMMQTALMGDDPSRDTDLFALGPETPCDDQSLARFYGEL